MIYFIKILDMRKKEYSYVLHYDKENGELILTTNVQDRQNYLSKESLLEDLHAIINSDHFDIKHNQIIVGAW